MGRGGRNATPVITGEKEMSARAEESVSEERRQSTQGQSSERLAPRLEVGRGHILVHQPGISSMSCLAISSFKIRLRDPPPESLLDSHPPCLDPEHPAPTPSLPLSYCMVLAWPLISPIRPGWHRLSALPRVPGHEVRKTAVKKQQKTLPWAANVLVDVNIEQLKEGASREPMQKGGRS